MIAPLPQTILFVVITSLLHFGCSGSDGDARSGAPATAAGVPAPAAGTGQLVLDVGKDVDPKTVEGYVVGSQELTVEAAAGGTFYIQNVPPGNHDIIITAGTLAVSTLTAADDRGIRLSAVPFVAGAAVKKPALDIPVAGSITGIVQHQNGTANLGIQVFIPGTSYLALTDDDGKFTISNVPVGTHELAFKDIGYHTSRMSDVQVTSGQVKTLADTVYLLVDTGASGQFAPQSPVARHADGNAIVDSRSVPLVIASTPDAVLMHISEDPTFTGANWVAVSPSYTYVFPQLDATDTKLGTAPKVRKLYIQFTSASGPASAPFELGLHVDIFHDNGGGTLAVNNNAATTTLQRVNLSIDPPKNAKTMRIATSSSFTGADWQDVSATVTGYLLPATTGTFTFYAQFRDADGFHSNIIQSSPITEQLFQSGGASITYSGATPSTSLTVNFNIVAPTNATQMWVSTDSYATGSWESVATTKQITVSSQGAYNATVKFRNADQVEFIDGSWTAAFNVDLFPSGTFSVSATTPTLAPPSAASWSLTVSRPTNGNDASQKILMDSTSFPAAPWDAIATTPTIGFASGDLGACGTHTVYLKFMTAGGMASTSAASTSLTYDCWDTAKPSTTGAPTGRMAAHSVWTGSRMIIWGGYTYNDGGGFTYVSNATGAIYDPSNASTPWTTLNTTNAPSGLVGGSAVWTGSKMIVWGGTVINVADYNTGKLLDPTGSGTWTNMNATGAPAARSRHTTVWTGTTGTAATADRMIVWGGGPSSSSLATGGLYDAVGDSWADTPTTGAPAARAYHSAVWTGNTGVAATSYCMIIYGGAGSSVFANGAALCYASGSWSWTTIPSSSTARYSHYAAVIGQKMYVWGGQNGVSALSSGEVFDFSGGFASGTWTALPSAPISARFLTYFSQVTGYVTSDNKFLVVGGNTNVNSDYSGVVSDGAVYDPVAGTWAAIAAPSGYASSRPATVWTGSKLILVGGGSGFTYGTGGATLTVPP